jgi:hypothetical protein
MPGTSDQWTALDRRYERLVDAGPDLLPTADSPAGTADSPAGTDSDSGPGMDADSPADQAATALAAQPAPRPAAQPAAPHVGRHRRLDGAGAAATVAA